jgi:predicted metalloprotease
MAHEFGHCIDAKYNVYSSRSFRNELFADYLAGCYLHLKSLSVGEQYVREVANTFYSIGDYAFNESCHHGTPDQRKSCLMAGYNFSKSKINIGYQIQEAILNAKNYVAQF